MAKRVLFISRSYANDSPVGVRFNSFIKHLLRSTDLTVLNIANDTFLYRNNGFAFNYLQKIIGKLPWIPDVDILILRKYKRRIRRLLNNEEFSTVIIGILPYSFLLLVRFIKKINPNIRIILDITDPPTANISFKDYSFIKRKALNKIEKAGLTYSDRVIVLNMEIKNYYEEKLNLNNLIVIEQGIDPEMINLEKESRSVIPVNFTYVGHLYEGGREPYELYNAFIRFKNEVKLNMYGGFKKSLQPPNYECFNYGGRISRELLREVYQKTDVIVFIDNRESLQVPGKTLEVLALNKPILFIYFNENSPTLNFIRGHEYVYMARNYEYDIYNSVKLISSTSFPIFNRKLDHYYWSNLLIRLNEIL